MGEFITWSLPTGKKIVSLQDSKHDEVSAFAIDGSAEYAVTGFRDGSGIVSCFLFILGDVSKIMFTS